MQRKGLIHILTIVIFNLFFLFIEPAETYAFAPKDNYLWIEFEECIKEKDGSVTLPLQINYGRFPNEKKEVSQLHDLRAFYTLTGKDDEGKKVLYEAKIRKDKGKCVVNINSFKANRFAVLVEAKKRWGEATHWYLAKTSFVLFGHSSSRRKEIKPVSSNEINRHLDLSITPEFHYWPQTGNPIKITSLFNSDHLFEKVIYLFDENGTSKEIKTDKTGYCIYVPPEDKRLNWKGETAFKQTVIVAEEIKGDMKYISSYTLLLHRNRFRNRKLLPGAGIFLGTMVSIFLRVIVKRKKFNFEAL